MITQASRTFHADGIIHSVRATNIIAGNILATAQVTAGGQHHREVTLLFSSPTQGQNIEFRVEVFAGVGMIKASMIFMTIALFISFLLK